MGFFNKYYRKDTEPVRKKLLIQGWCQILIYVEIVWDYDYDTVQGFWDYFESVMINVVDKKFAHVM